jgi:hypothetical protein
MPTHAARLDAAPPDAQARGAYFRELAARFRTMAESARDRLSKESFLNFAGGYDDLAGEAEALAGEAEGRAGKPRDASPVN